jgi:hypothetical protein
MSPSIEAGKSQGRGDGNMATTVTISFTRGHWAKDGSGPGTLGDEAKERGKESIGVGLYVL